MRPRGQVLVALVTLVVVIAGGIVLERSVGLARRGTVARPTASSGVWYCPHGGGTGWSVIVRLANPGARPVTARVSTLGGGRPADPQELTVPAGKTVGVEVDAPERASATDIEYFGGWIAAGWVARAGGDEVGVAAEPCMAEAGVRWTLADATTEEGESAYAVVMNPFASDAVFDLTLLTEDQPPRSKPEWSDYVLPAGRSVALDLGFLLGERTVAASIQVSIGRVAAASLGVSGPKATAEGIRSADGWLGAPPRQTILPGGGDSGVSDLVLADPEARPASFTATVLGPSGLGSVAPKLEQAVQDGEASSTVSLDTADPSTIIVRASSVGSGVVVARRTRGRAQDLAATSGVPEAGHAWIVMPATGGAPQSPRIVVANPGRAPAAVTLTLLPSEGSAKVVRIRVRPGRTIEAPMGLVQGTPNSAVLVVAEPGAIVPASASYSQGEHGVAAYGVSVGVPIPSSFVASVSVSTPASASASA